MELQENEAGGISVALFPGDDLDGVPDSHRKLLTPVLRQVFADPSAYFTRIADRSPFSSFSQWLKAVVAEDDWQLNLHQGIPLEYTAAGFCWWSDRVRSAEIMPSDGRVPSSLPRTIHQFHLMVESVQWLPFGRAGGLYGPAFHTVLTEFPGYEFTGLVIEPASTSAFVWSPNGDMMVYTADERSGWLDHETGEIRLIGSIKDAIEWLFAELLNNRCPDLR